MLARFDPIPGRPAPLPLANAPATERRVADEDPRARVWRCRACTAPITSDDSRCEVDGRHVHLRLNPAAFAFIFGCFREAPGCVVVGPPTAEASWFGGCVWEFSLCGTCGAHLGWAFSGAMTFFGLVLDRLVEPPPPVTTS